MWGFRTPRQRGGALRAAKSFLRANAALLGISPSLEGLRFQKQIRSLGADHLIFQQVVRRRRVHRAYVTVHVSRSGQIYLVKNRAAPEGLFPTEPAFRIPRDDALRRARRALRLRRGTVQDIEPMWFPAKGRVHAAWRVRIARASPREEWIVYVNARTGGILSRYDNLSEVSGRARVFDPNPVTALNGHDRLITDDGELLDVPDEAYRTVTVRGLGPSGFLSGARVTTAPTRRRIRRRNHRYLLRSTDRGFEEAMAYHHVDEAVRYLERLGFRGSRALFSDPIRINVNGTPDDNSWYSPWEKLLTFGRGDIQDAEDGETILHEFGHAVQDAIIPDFGQSEEAAAMGEGFGDYFAASFFAGRKPEPYRPTVMSWDGLLIGRDAELDPPVLRRLDWDWTYGDFRPGDDEHDNGEIWSATLWDIRNALGGEQADRLIVESHFQLDGFTTFARGARAILDADANLHRGHHGTILRRLFRRRRIGPI